MQYAVLGHYDYLTMVEAESNEAVARLSAELGFRTGMRFETLTGIRHTVFQRVENQPHSETEPENQAQPNRRPEAEKPSTTPARTLR